MDTIETFFCNYGIKIYQIVDQIVSNFIKIVVIDTMNQNNY